jgi:SAM-dependent methyltransferase
VRWQTKARVQRAFSVAPGGHRLNYALQRFVTRSLPRPPAVMDEVVATARRHLEAVERHAPGPLDQLRFFEFGAGWDLATPLAMASLGVRHQLLFDRYPVARWNLIQHAVADLRSRGLDLPEVTPGRAQGDYLASIGIEYVAPGDARATGLPDGSIDVAVSTSVLEHVDEPDIRAICRELRRILSTGGICSFAIDYHDHYAGSDSSIDGLNFLRYDDAEWRHWNCALQNQNRLRHLDFVALFEDAGFELAVVEPVEDPAFPAEPDVAERFKGRTDLRVGDGWFVLRQPPATPTTADAAHRAAP